jgi:MFS family permease
VLKLTGDPLALGMVLAVGSIPRAAVMLVGGAITDRFSSRLIMLASDMIRLVLTLIMLVLVWTGQMQVWMLYLLSFTGGIVSGFFMPASSSIVPALVPQEDLQAGNSVFQGSSQLIGFVGPALAGALSRWNVSILLVVSGVGMILLALWLITQSRLELMATPLATGVSPQTASQD